jgi:ABC-type lipoprotein release transport system permease subunit
MLYGLKIAARYLTASKAQTALLVVGVAVGVFIFIFMSALIGGLAEFILSRTAGDISHVTIEAEATDPALLMALPGRVLLVQEPSTNTPQLREAISYTPLIEALPEVKAVSPQITGAGFLRRGTQVAQVSIIGLEPGRESAISDLEGYLVDGEVRLRSGAVLLGKSLVDDMGLALGQTISLESTDGIKAALTLTGIYQIGTGGGPDRRMAYVSLATARTLFEMPQGVSRIEIKLFERGNALLPYAKIGQKPRQPGRVRAMHDQPPRAKAAQKGGGLTRLTAPEQNAAGTGDRKGRHTDMVAATARPQRAYLASRIEGSIAGVKRRSSAHELWKSSGGAQSPA